MSKVQSPESEAGSKDKADLNRRDVGPWTLDLGPALEPSPDEFAVLSSFERFAFRLVRRMNQGRWKRFLTWCQKAIGAGWIHFATYNLMQVYGLEHIEAVSRSRPILIVANHRSFFDMFTVSTVLFRHTSWRKQLFFPVRGRFLLPGPLACL